MAEALADSKKVTLFSQKTRGGLTYRIPALLYLPYESTFLAFAEERSSPRDEDAKFLVMRRGKKEGTSVQWGPQESLMAATLPKCRTMNPCPLYEEKSGTIFLFFICVRDHVTAQCQILTGRNAARLCYISSRDCGRTWSLVVDLTEKANPKNWATFAVGPGHGVQLSSGRLVIPAYAYYIHKPCFCFFSFCYTHPHCFTLYSDDGGRNWTRGRLLESVRTTECQVAELTCRDDRRVLYINARNSCREQCRAEAFSHDWGCQFEGSFLCRELCEPPKGCQGSVVNFGSSDLGESQASSGYTSSRSWLIFSHPTSRCQRVDLGIYLNMSPLEKGSWKGPWVLNEGPSGYSDLAVCKEGKSLLFGCLFECGTSSAYEEIAFQLFSDVELLRNVRES
nr:sialidase-3-like [Anolis sagrei ordinatus]